MMKAIVAGHGYKNAPTVGHCEEYLQSCVVPDLHEKINIRDVT